MKALFPAFGKQCFFVVYKVKQFRIFGDEGQPRGRSGLRRKHRLHSAGTLTSAKTNLSVLKLKLTNCKVATLRTRAKGSGEQISYERSSQAQSFTIPPNLLAAVGEIDFAGWRFKFVEKESLN